jgi:hypothetical protein
MAVDNWAGVSEEDIESVTYDELIKFLLERNAKGKCECCSTESWSVSIESDQTHPMILRQRSNRFPTDGVLSFVMMCKNCGNLRHIAAKFAARSIIEDRKK